MKKSILNLGKALNKTSQKQINGGANYGGGCYQKSVHICCQYYSWGEFCDAGKCGTFGCFWY
ncbi:hypothetical protein P8625_06950 [Tenacibaculum tangerinum]|uniref:Bacteriocin n=1 Tax=Tenacibaculum tangerinum TaxID=3038772 RepID=A0ABY8L9R7_9FLAO|nr:hypothetical protein [Tenacibaculum tangerinum]WGH76874.1 hypothetical protein P8625_06950 [Tenacibaculum tangerinum]